MTLIEILVSIAVGFVVIGLPIGMVIAIKMGSKEKNN